MNAVKALGNIVVWVAALFMLQGGYACGGEVTVDSCLTPDEAVFSNQPPDVVPGIQKKLALADVRYYGYDGRVHQGQIVVHEALLSDIRQVFDVILKTRFPVESVLPIAHPLIQRKGPYGLSPDTNNTSGYVWRPIMGARKLSLHALGMAVDINPRQNPYMRGDLILPPQAVYSPSVPGTLTADSPVVQVFKQLGWEWGGEWTEGTVDYMHFQKVPSGWAEWVEEYSR